jgi:uncharacterized membrane protein YgcG
MSPLRIALGVALVVTAGCVEETAQQSTFPEPVQVAGPPGGEIDPGYGYAPEQAQTGWDSANYPSLPGEAPGEAPSDQMPEPSADPQDPGYVMGAVTDTEIDSTLDGYGSWEETEDYGRVWRPDATVVGVDFTPYETCGSWAYTDYGWNFSCDDYGWGWLPFHYGRWGWFDDYWGWVPGYEYSPAWVEWRHGGGYVGWRPLGPEVRDHRGEHHAGPIVRDHRHASQRDSHWRFTTVNDFGRPHVRSHLFKDPAEGLRVTAPVATVPFRGPTEVRAASLMRARLASSPQWRGGGGHSTMTRPPVQSYRPPVQSYRPPMQTYQPTYRPPAQTYQPTYRPPAQTYQPTYRPPVQTYRPPVQTYRPPVQTYRPPPMPTYHPPAPSHSYSPPSHSYSPPSHSYSPPSHSSGGGGWSGGGGHSSGGGGHGGGGHHR